MIWFLFRRLLWMIGTLWVVFTVTFFLMHAVPGGPFSSERKPPDGIREAMDSEVQSRPAGPAAVSEDA